MSRAGNQFLRTITVHFVAEDLEIYADPMIEKVFYNLFDNAFRYGDGISCITISAEIIHDSLTIVFKDDGKGILQNEKEKIFLQGYGKNTGLGLFLSHEILSITHMRITETGEYLKGARFEIHIPAGYFRKSGNPRKE